MNRKHRTFIILALFLHLFSVEMYAQSAKWAIPPTYKSLERYSETMFKVKQDNLSGIVNNEGKIIAAPRADSITPIVDGYGLVLRREGINYRLIGFVGVDESYVSISQPWYIGEFPFFSEGMLPIRDDKGLYGYMDYHGRLALDFEYAVARPFSDGYAVVSPKANFLKKATGAIGLKGKMRFTYINLQGQELKLPKEVGTLYFASTFKNGEAVVSSDSDRYIFIDKQGRILRITSQIELRFNRSYALGEDEDNSYNITPRYGATTFSNVKGVGYQSSEREVLPAQFAEAYPFTNGFAIAKLQNGMFGVLREYPDSFECVVESVEADASNPEQSIVNFRCVVPQAWRNELLAMRCVVNNQPYSQTMPVSNQADRIVRFTLPNANPYVEITGGGLLLFAGSDTGFSKALESLRVEQSAEVLEELQVWCSAKEIKASYANFNQPSLGVVVSNPSEREITIRVAVTSQNRCAINQVITLAPQERRQISGSFNASGLTAIARHTLAIKLSIPNSDMSRMVYRAITVHPIFEEF